MNEVAARKVASDWHDGQDSATYAFASTGTIRPDLLDELRASLDSMEETYPAIGADHDELARLISYVEEQSKRVATVNVPAQVFVSVDLDSGEVTAVHILPAQEPSQWYVSDMTKAAQSDDDSERYALEIASSTTWKPLDVISDPNGACVWEG